MPDMARKRTKKELEFLRTSVTKTTEESKNALSAVTLALKRRGLQFNGGPPTIEFVFSATWLWMESLDIAAVDAGLRAQIPKLLEIMRTEKAELAGEEAATPANPGNLLVPNARKPKPERRRRS